MKKGPFFKLFFSFFYFSNSLFLLFFFMPFCSFFQGVPWASVGPLDHTDESGCQVYYYICLCMKFTLLIFKTLLCELLFALCVQN